MPPQPHLLPYFVSDDGGAFLQLRVVEGAYPQRYLRADVAQLRPGASVSPSLPSSLPCAPLSGEQLGALNPTHPARRSCPSGGGAP